MPRTREVAWQFVNRTEALTVAHSEIRPETELEALMKCPPGVEPERSRAELAPLREIIACSLEETLDERERWIFDALFSRRLSERQLAAELSLSRVHIRRLRDEILEKLRTQLGAQPAVQNYLEGK